MKLVEQAIYTLVDADPEAGYQVVASSPGVYAADVRELTVWGPSRDSMPDADRRTESFNFHPLPSGAYCVSRSKPAGWERSGGQRVFTHCLIVPPEALSRFANNPFALVQVMSENDLWLDPGSPCPRLKAFAPPDGAAPVDQVLLRQLATAPGPRSMALLMQQVCNSLCLALAGPVEPVSVMAGLFSCLPLECRLEFSFSTGLKFSPWRPFRIVTLSDDPAERLWVASYPNVTVLDLVKDTVPRSSQFDGWATLVERVLATDHIPFFASQISKRRFDLTLDDLPALGLQLLEGLDCSDFHDDPPPPEPRPSLIASLGQRAHAAHRLFEKNQASATATATSSVAGPSEQLGVHSPEVLEKLEHLDDLVYEAISGQTKSLEQLRIAWPKIHDELGTEMLAESQEQYLRYALSIWSECSDSDTVRNPAQAIHALEVLCLLFGDVT
jgi:hypothetical protein